MTATTDTGPDELRNRMVDHIAEAGHLRSDAVEHALRTVPHHLFVPAATVENAYVNRSITIKPGEAGGRPASCISVPTVVAMMLDQLDARPGHRVLEVGAGTGYNTALLAELVGATGQVTTIDIHPDVTTHARRALDVTGYDRVHVVTGDGSLGYLDHAPMTGRSSPSARGTCRPSGRRSWPPVPTRRTADVARADPQHRLRQAGQRSPARHRQQAVRLHPHDR
jgi:protein-L-isoaspartate(D-aspartate) O-methyltransferase